MVGMDFGLSQRNALAMTPTLRQAIGFLGLSNVQLSARLADLVAQNTLLQPVPAVEAGSWLALMRQIAPPPGPVARLPRPDAPALGGAETDRIANADPGLVAHVMAQLPLLVRDPADLPIAHAFVSALEPSGWLGVGPDRVAAEAGCSPGRAEAVLRQLQGAEPTGLFARSLAECLGLQAQEQGLLTPAFAALLRNLPLLAAGDHAALARACGCDEAVVLSMARALRGLNPKPGAAFGQARAALPAPDLILRPDGDGWLLELNARTAQALALRQGSAAAPPAAMREARALIQGLERRHATVLAIAAEIVARQDAFVRGLAPLAALTINDLASATGLHRSTVSRVTAALTLALPKRTLGLRDLMCAAAPAARRQDDPPSVQAVLARLRAIVATEDPADPLTDLALAKRLLPEGAALARRTVAKYRKLAGIPPRAARRRLA